MTTPNGQISPVRVFFLGSGRIGMPILEALHHDPRIDLVGVGSQPPKPGKRGRMTPTNLGTKAKELGFEVCECNNVNAPGFLQQLRELHIDLLVVVAFGQILRKDLLDLPPFGCLNVHASLLPKYRGASPVEAAILNGDPTSGVAFMRMEAGLDTGPVYRTYCTEITDTDTTDMLKDRLGKVAAQHAAEVIWQIVREGLPAIPQDDTLATKVGKIHTDAAALSDWNQDAVVIDRMVRAYRTRPKAFLYLYMSSRKKLFRMQVLKTVVEPHRLQPGEIPGTILPEPEDPIEQAAREKRGERRFSDEHQGIRVLCREGILKILWLCLEGQSETSGLSFLRGNTLGASDILVGWQKHLEILKAKAEQEKAEAEATRKQAESQL